MRDAVLEEESGQPSAGLFAERPSELFHCPVAQVVAVAWKSGWIDALARELEHLLRPLQPRRDVLRRPRARICCNCKCKVRLIFVLHLKTIS